MKKCDRCQDREATIRVTGDWSEWLCLRCYNEEVADESKVTLETMPEELAVRDFTGVRRSFLVLQRLHPNGIFIEAVENTDQKIVVNLSPSDQKKNGALLDLAIAIAVLKI
ncbi:hypothetical protein FIU87_19520 [Bacillus sp. THAF10]|uniref:DUF7685 domain-containing protein n=1 Tax=Bacillus sp. THAF10 TaxID=2587848 RepID=UPI0012AA4BF2|nr:magnesium chelatase domain-containing protein [Bacillus sp. THAF10]QFT90840.1 hypothetical protein FIU87_19520 [Bacillus sp. THAF10]